MDFVKRPAEEERLLSDLIDIDENDGEDAVIDKIDDIRGDYLSGTGDRREVESGNRALIGLAKAGLIDCKFSLAEESYGGLTSLGRSYFEDKAEAEKAWQAEHRHDYRVAAFGAVAGGLLGLVSGAFSAELMAWVKAILP